MTPADVTMPIEPAPAQPRGAGSRGARWAEALIPRACGLVFLYAGAGKAWDPTSTHRVFAFDGVPQVLVAPLTHAVWMGEVVLGLVLLIGVARRRGLTIAILALFAYSVQLAYLIAAQDPPNCSCIALAERFASAKQAMMIGLVRNAVMAASLEWVRLRMVGREIVSRTAPANETGDATPVEATTGEQTTRAVRGRATTEDG